MALAERQVAMIALASGRFKDVSLPSPWSVQHAEFDVWLASEPEQGPVLDLAERELREVLGVR